MMKLPSCLQPEGILTHIRFFIILILVLIADQVTKLYIIYNIVPGTYDEPDSIVVVKDFFYIVHVHNTGEAWSIFNKSTYLLSILGIIALACIFIFRKQLELKKYSMQYTFGFLSGGILGNVLDRLYYGYVIDFIDIHLPFYRWPAFNIADSAITIGVFLYLYHHLIATNNHKTK